MWRTCLYFQAGLARGHKGNALSTLLLKVAFTQTETDTFCLFILSLFTYFLNIKMIPTPEYFGFFHDPTNSEPTSHHEWNVYLDWTLNLNSTKPFQVSSFYILCQSGFCRVCFEHLLDPELEAWQPSYEELEVRQSWLPKVVPDDMARVNLQRWPRESLRTDHVDTFIRLSTTRKITFLQNSLRV